jgi:hypothetical protein
VNPQKPLLIKAAPIGGLAHSEQKFAQLLSELF